MAIYKANNLSPSDSAIDANIENEFSWDEQGSAQTDYQVRIYNNLTDVLVHDSTKITSTNNYYDLAASTLSNGTEYKWYVESWSGVSSANSEYEFFIASATPVVSFSDPVFGATPVALPTQDYTFVLNYSQAQSVSLKKFKFDLYDSTGTTLISTSDWIYDPTPQYEFTGMVNGTYYQIEGTVVSQYDLEATTGKQDFYISYSLPDNVPSITLTPNDTNGSVSVSWANLKQVLGVVTGSSSYVSGKFNYGLELTSGSDIAYSEVFQDYQYTFTYWFKLPYAHDGDFMQIGLNKTIGYEASSNKFYIDDNGFKEYSDAITLYTWEDISGDTWADFPTGIWSDLGLTGTDYTYNWMFIGITSNDIIVKLHNELRAYIEIT